MVLLLLVLEPCVMEATCSGQKPELVWPTVIKVGDGSMSGTDWVAWDEH